jgi:hypothetical protein
MEQKETQKGRLRGLNPGPPPPKGGIIPLDQADNTLSYIQPPSQSLYTFIINSSSESINKYFAAASPIQIILTTSEIICICIHQVITEITRP